LKTTNLPKILLQVTGDVDQRGHQALLLISITFLYNFSSYVLSLFKILSHIIKKDNVKNSCMLLCLNSLSRKSYEETQRKLHKLLT